MKKLITMAVALAMLVMMPSAAFAAAPAPDAVITGGTLAITELGIANFTPVTLTGIEQTTTAVVADTELTDPTGLGDGWKVSLQASAFTLDAAHSILLTGGIASIVGTGTVEAPEFAAVLSSLGTLPQGSLQLDTVSIAVAPTGAGSTDVTNMTVAQGKIDTATGINILSAPIDAGMGTYTVSMLPMTVTLEPATTYAGTYTSTVTQTLTSGPVA
ncbi:MAG: hypothetical protein JJE36_05210 [Coriobacteriia bacterium]|nr:hypothetical protein [Coriobacteriia bacterium]